MYLCIYLGFFYTAYHQRARFYSTWKIITLKIIYKPQLSQITLRKTAVIGSNSQESSILSDDNVKHATEVTKVKVIRHPKIASSSVQEWSYIKMNCQGWKKNIPLLKSFNF